MIALMSRLLHLLTSSLSRRLQIKDQLKALQAEMEVLKMHHSDPGGEQAALQMVRQLASAPAKLRDHDIIGVTTFVRRGSM